MAKMMKLALLPRKPKSMKITIFNDVYTIYMTSILYIYLSFIFNKIKI